MKIVSIYNKQTCKANIGRNTLLHLRLWIGIENRFKDVERNIHDKINMRSMYVIPMLKPFNN